MGKLHFPRNLEPNKCFYVFNAVNRTLVARYPESCLFYIEEKCSGEVVGTLVLLAVLSERLRDKMRPRIRKKG